VRSRQFRYNDSNLKEIV